MWKCQSLKTGKMLDYIGIFKKLNDEGINYIVAGGLAVNFYGIPRMTYDIDILVDLEEKNLKKLLSLLEAWNFKPRAPVKMMNLTNPIIRQNWIKNKGMKAFTLINPDWVISEIDIIIDSPIDFLEASKKINCFEIKDVKVPVISLDDLITMKESSQREQDKADIRHLQRIKEEE